GAVIQEESRLTRDGSFKVQFDDDEGGYVLHTPSGHILTDNNGVNIVLPEPVQNIEITPEGALTANGVAYGNIGIWKVDNPDQLKQVGQNLFDAELASGENPATKYANAIDEGIATLRQGALEGSNVTMTEEMSQLVNIQRAYQLNSRAIGISDQMMGIAN
ncbi:flagellar hook-basal body complex protein, partial [Mesorhizobium sp. M00.F.Ca.ET.186.01.1.1]